MPAVAEFTFATLLVIGALIGAGLMVKLGWKLLRPERQGYLPVNIIQDGKPKNVRMHNEDIITVTVDGEPVISIKNFGSLGLEVLVTSKSEVKFPTKHRIVEV
jgi:hypothetical protein